MVHLHTHTMYSLRDSIIRIDELTNRLQELGQDTIAITEHGRNLGSVTIYKQFKKDNIKYIHGCEVYICDDVSIKDKGNKYYHLILLCKNDIGRLNLNKLLSISEHPDNKYVKPRIDFNILENHSEGLICLSACMAGEISRFLEVDNELEAEKRALKYSKLFKDDYYLEIQAHSDTAQISQNKKIISLATRLNIDTVVTCDAHYVYKEDKKYQNKYAFNGAYKEVDEAYVDCYIQSEDEVRYNIQYFTKEIIDKCIENTNVISNKCNVNIPLSAPIMPHLDTPKEFSNNKDWLINVCAKGFIEKLNIDYHNKSVYDKNKWFTRYIYDENDEFLKNEEYQFSTEEIKEYIDRFEYELDSLYRMGFIDYILLVYSYANIAKRRGIARGSGGGSIICYVSNITDIDPIEHKLYFERFIDVGALDLLESGEITVNELKIPDIDLDFSSEGRTDVINFLCGKYGEDKVASIGRFGSNKTKGTIKDMCKVLDIDLEEAGNISKSFDFYELNEVDLMISGDIPIEDKAKNAITDVKKYKELFDYVRKLNGLPKSFGLHPCFTKGYKVRTSCGYKNIEDVKVNDYVFTHKGSLKQVVNAFSKESDDLYDVKISGTRPLKVTGEHPFYTMRRDFKTGQPKLYDNPTWINVEDLKKGDMVGIHIDENSCLENPFTDLPLYSEDFWWIVGRFVGDGWTTNIKGRNECRTEICCNKNNNEINDIEERFSKLNIPYRILKKETSINLISQNKELNMFFNKFGKYAHGKIIPNFVLQLPINYLKIFLEGYFSADGHVTKKNYQTFKTVSLDLALGLQKCIHKTYKTFVSLSVIPAKTEVIEGRTVQSKEKYILGFKKTINMKDRTFYKDGYIWTPITKINKLSNIDTVYNITVLDDSSYTVENISVHNCGKIVSTKELDFYTPSCYDKDGVRYLQGDMHDVEDMGLIKVDVLGLRTLNQEYDTLEMSNESKNFINSKQDFSDPKVLNIFKKGNTVGIFQFSSSGMKKTLQKMNVRCIDDISVANALFRPGAMAYIDNFCDRRKGVEDFKYLHSDLEEILKSTYGIMVFQEQLIEIGKLAKIKNPDKLRKATGKKDIKMLNQVKPELEENLKERGWSQEQFDQLWADMIEFSKYSFNKSHSSAYAILAYMTAKQKAYYPKEFYAGLLNSYIGESSFVKDNASEIISDMSRHGISFNKLDFRSDHRRCSIDKNGINYAICLIKDCNESMSNQLYELRNNKYDTFIELVIDMNEKKVLNKAQLDILIKLDFFSEFGNSRELLKIVEVATQFKFGESKTIKKDKIDSEELLEVVKKYATDKNAKGKELKGFTFIDLKGMLIEYEYKIKSLNLEDLSFRLKIVAQQEFLGYISLVSGKDEDRSKLYIKEFFIARRKSDNKAFGVSILCQSIGSGIQNRFTIFTKNINRCGIIKEGDIIQCLKWSKNGDYYNIDDYIQIV